MSHRQQLQSLAMQLEVFKSQHAAMALQIDAMARELAGAFATAPAEEKPADLQIPKEKYFNMK